MLIFLNYTNNIASKIWNCLFFNDINTIAFCKKKKKQHCIIIIEKKIKGVIAIINNLTQNLLFPLYIVIDNIVSIVLRLFLF